MKTKTKVNKNKSKKSRKFKFSTHKYKQLDNKNIKKLTDICRKLMAYNEKSLKLLEEDRKSMVAGSRVRPVPKGEWSSIKNNIDALQFDLKQTIKELKLSGHSDEEIDFFMKGSYV